MNTIVRLAEKLGKSFCVLENRPETFNEFQKHRTVILRELQKKIVSIKLVPISCEV
jgi:hypothetical protein